jgi:hypothetical protein
MSTMSVNVEAALASETKPKSKPKAKKKPKELCALVSCDPHTI